MATSPLFGWEEPDDTDLVKDGAAAIRTLGNAIDTSMGDLLGGTSGQVLSKNSNTNMDFTWVTSDDANAIQNAIVDAKGDLITATAADTPARLAVGTNGQTLVADSTASTGLKWATPASGGMTLLSTTTLSGATVTVTVAGGYKSIIAVCLNMTNATADGKFRCAPNGTFNANYVITKSALGTVTTYADVTDYIQVSGYVDMARANTNNAFTLKIDNYDLATSGTVRAFNIYGGCINTAGTQSSINVGGAWGSGYGTAITSLVFSNSGGNLSAGTVLLYGVN